MPRVEQLRPETGHSPSCNPNQAKKSMQLCLCSTCAFMVFTGTNLFFNPKFKIPGLLTNPIPGISCLWFWFLIVGHIRSLCFLVCGFSLCRKVTDFFFLFVCVRVVVVFVVAAVVVVFVAIVVVFVVFVAVVVFCHCCFCCFCCRCFCCSFLLLFLLPLPLLLLLHI